MMGGDDRGPKIIFGVLVLVVLIGMLLGGAMMGPGMMGPGMMWGVGGPDVRPGAGGWTWGFAMAFGTLMMLAFWAALILGAVLVVRWAIGRPSQATGRPRPEDPLEILRRRYANGEIDQATYQRMKGELEDDAGITPRQTVGADRTGR
jgi:putative membrane protein